MIPHYRDVMNGKDWMFEVNLWTRTGPSLQRNLFFDRFQAEDVTRVAGWKGPVNAGGTPFWTTLHLCCKG